MTFNEKSTIVSHKPPFPRVGVFLLLSVYAEKEALGVTKRKGLGVRTNPPQFIDIHSLCYCYGSHGREEHSGGGRGRGGSENGPPVDPPQPPPLRRRDHSPPCLPLHQVKEPQEAPPQGIPIGPFLQGHLQLLHQRERASIFSSDNCIFFPILWGVNFRSRDFSFQANIEIIVTEGDQEGGKIASMVREIGASTLVLGLHDRSFLYK